MTVCRLSHLNIIVMKTNISIRHAETLEDIVFEHRNKAYGAYYLSKKAWKYLSMAFLIMLGAVTSAFTIALSRPAAEAEVPTGQYIKTDIIMTRYDHEDLSDFEIPEPASASMLKQVEYVEPIVVKDAELSESIAITDIMIKETKNEEVDADLVLVVEEFPVITEEKKEKPFIFVEEQASFQGGGLEQFHSWVSANLVYPQIAIDNDISGRVFVQFCVDSKGQVTDVAIVRGLDASINNEVTRVLLSSPGWLPARQGGITVKQLFSMSVIFDLQKASAR